MKNEQQQQAKNLYLQTDLTKTQIAEILSISRTSVHYWVKDGNWDRLKTNARHLPSLLAENCYHVMGHLTESILSERRKDDPCTHKEADTLHKLTLTINKLKNRSTLNENMETFAFFFEDLNKKNPALVQQLMPYVDQYITARASVTADQLMPPGFTKQGFRPAQTPNPREQQLDLQDISQSTEKSALPQAAQNIKQTDNPTSALPADRLGDRHDSKTQTTQTHNNPNSQLQTCLPPGTIPNLSSAMHDSKIPPSIVAAEALLGESRQAVEKDPDYYMKASPETLAAVLSAMDEILAWYNQNPSLIAA